MSRWQDSAEDGGDPLQGWDQAFELYLRYLSWGRLGLGLAFLFPFMPLGIMALGQPWSQTVTQLREPALAVVCLALVAWVLSAICLGPEGQANEGFYLSNLAQSGFDPRRGCDTRQPPLSWLSLTWLVYQSDVGYYPGGHRSLSFRDWNERYQAWWTMRGIINAYFRACMAAGFPPLRPGELAAVVAQGAVSAAGLALFIAYIALHHGQPPPAGYQPVIPVSAFLVFVYSGILQSLRSGARLTALINALQTHLAELPALAAKQPDGPADPQDTGWG
jgi:hypothetical protein